MDYKMKTIKNFAIIFLLASSLFAQQRSHIFTLGEKNIGAYVGTSGKYTTINSEAAGFLDFKGAIVLNSNWAVGLSLSGLYYDKPLDKLVNDGTYHLYITYGGIYLEKLFSLTENLKFSLALQTGQGEIYYQYDKDFRKEKLWSEEIIDRTTFHYWEPSLDIQYRLTGNYWIGLTGSYRNTPPIHILGTDESFLQNFSGGLTFKYGIF
jgi:hypothetical protein